MQSRRNMDVGRRAEHSPGFSCSSSLPSTTWPPRGSTPLHARPTPAGELRTEEAPPPRPPRVALLGASDNGAIIGRGTRRRRPPPSSKLHATLTATTTTATGADALSRLASLREQAAPGFPRRAERNARHYVHSRAAASRGRGRTEIAHPASLRLRCCTRSSASLRSSTSTRSSASPRE